MLDAATLSVAGAVSWAFLWAVCGPMLAMAVSAPIGLLGRRRSPATRYAAYCISLACGVLALPIAVAAMFLLPLPWIRAVIQPLSPISLWLAAFWGFGTAWAGIQLAGGWLCLRRRVQAAYPCADSDCRQMVRDMARAMRIRRPVDLLESSHAGSPMVVGIVRPAILMPLLALLELTPRQRRAVLAHEFAHIRRHDCLVNLLLCAVEGLLFFHPAVWWLAQQIRTEREHCCDDDAVRICDDPILYLRSLGALELLRSREALPAAAASDGSVVSRMHRLADAARDR